jgi:hypothetical protein
MAVSTNYMAWVDDVESNVNWNHGATCTVSSTALPAVLNYEDLMRAQRHLATQQQFQPQLAVNPDWSYLTDNTQWQLKNYGTSISLDIPEATKPKCPENFSEWLLKKYNK